jgi:hypothetical protein
MLGKIKRLFVIKTRFEASLIIYALALGCIERGIAYLDRFPGTGGYLLMAACTGSVFLGGAKIFDALRYEREAAAAQAIDNTALLATTDS